MSAWRWRQFLFLYIVPPPDRCCEIPRPASLPALQPRKQAALALNRLAISAAHSDRQITDIDISKCSQGEVYPFERTAEDWRYKEKLSERVPIQAGHEYVTFPE